MPIQTEIKGIFAAGVTGGHIYPALAVADEISKIVKLKALFVGTGRGAEAKIFKNFKYEYIQIPAAGSDSSRIKYLYKNAIATLKISRLISKFSPDFVFTTGGYIGGITGYVAHKKGIPLFLHESNVQPGISTKKLSEYAMISFCAFEETARSLKNGLFVGMPVREGFESGKDPEFLKKFPAMKVLAFGGSEGSNVIDRIVENLSKRMKEITFFHIGPSKIENDNVVNFEYYENIPYLMRNCDVIISRAGASTIAEIIQSAKPAILVPWKGSLNGHQELNAKYLEKMGGAFVVDEEKIDLDDIISTIQKLSQSQFYETISNNLKKLRPAANPSLIIAKQIIEKVS
ncbi:UDP-N-acetylglucosamine--N-acetylmuramyl-(pentapeptide) pyrophosphoryl-undecaprenol N-acetylglucosamine transferase [Athalassotoga saccharophila]|uniref:UDP-N-acetylglucosamine--N-acetylmuramyl- (pentapeptide) pyrophosphoryl-undecaprenol N-acetylglucosamine transferase n=1 Tax=Athalassotoga saccharophila TaxID=1441386 RepID=UPI00137A2FBA|nr:UDP-N-acetylglucosamine--N-acetylmuramyl-(pentapeptide) pyrophosphoryl-undecaprenol N-acetylglucosamine transferase [Athalassotoga saccharophila]BBJ27544.1 UDP-N-acetylglucosamine--N-acetylmuramyl-(pentapeptide) pyrophosphoryl-undecaprenol N-acetylglucosamine transferase [Athalassotoga saccharophila]